MTISCSTSWDDKYNDTTFDAVTNNALNISNDSIAFSYEASSQQFSISTNSYWTISTSANWVQLSNSQGKGDVTVTVSADANTGSTKSRTATITVSNAIDKHNISLTQGGVPAPTIGGISVSDVTKHTANCKFSFASQVLDVTEYGVCYSNTSNAPGKDNATTIEKQEGDKSGNPTIAISELKSKTTYNVRAYIITALGIQYSETIQFTTPASIPNENDNGTPRG